MKRYGLYVSILGSGRRISNEQQETQKLPDWGKVEFYKYPAKPWSEVLKGASSKGRDLVTKLVRYESSQRMSAAEVCNCTDPEPSGEHRLMYLY